MSFRFLVLVCIRHPRKVVNVLDPVYTLHSEEAYAENDSKSAHDMLEEIAAVGRALEDGWNIHCNEWETAYNLRMNVPCTRDESGPYGIHYAREFDADEIDDPLDEAGFTAM